MSRQPEPPASIAPVWFREAVGQAICSRYGLISGDDDVARAVWDALLAEGERWQRIGRAFYDDTDEGQPVLVIPLPVVEPRDTEQQA